MNDFENQIEKEAGNNFPDVKDLANLYIELQKVSDEVQQLQNKNIAEEEFIKKVLLKRFQKIEGLCIMNLAFYERRASNAKYFINTN